MQILGQKQKRTCNRVVECFRLSHPSRIAYAFSAAIVNARNAKAQTRFANPQTAVAFIVFFVLPVTSFGNIGENYSSLSWGLSNAAVTQNSFLDVTKAPYNLNNTGSNSAASSNTTSLQNAIDDARANNLAVFLPPGTYVLNNQIVLSQENSDIDNTNVIIGSASGARPVIKLKDSSAFPNGSNKANTKVLFDYTGAAAEGYNVLLRGFDIDLGNNPGAIGVRLHGAQGCTIQDMTFSGSNYFAGLEDLVGSGGYYGNLTFIGGKYGIYADDARPTGVLAGFTFINQTIQAFYMETIYSPVMVGFRIEQNNPNVAFDVTDGASQCKTHLTLVDGSIEYTGQKATRAIRNRNRSVYLRNVYVKNCTKVVDNDQGADVTGVTGWTHVGDYAFYHIADRQLINSNYYSDDYGSSSITTNSSAPPSDLISRHIWDEASFPHWENPNVIIMGPGSPNDDDGARIQDKIDTANGKPIFLEKGDYLLKTGITLELDTKLFGVSSNLTRLGVASSFTANAPNWDYMIKTPNNADAECMLAFMRLRFYNEYNRVGHAKWRAGRHSMIRQVHFRTTKTQTPDEGMRRIVVTGHGGGRWYGFFGRKGQESYHNSHRYFLVEGVSGQTSEPLWLYAFTMEYQKSETYQTEIKNAQNVTIYGLKCETITSSQSEHDKKTPCLGINNSSNILVAQCGGHGDFSPILPYKNRARVEIFGGSTDVMIANDSGGWSNDNGWYIVKNLDDNKGITKNSSKQASFYLKGNSPQPMVYDPGTPPPSGGNLVLNPSFELDLADWGGNSNATITSGGSQEGVKHATIDPTGSNLRLEQWIDVTAGNTYTVSGWMRLDGNVQGTGAYIQVKEYQTENGATSAGGNTNICGTAINGTQGWTYYTDSITMHAETGSIRLRLICHGDDTVGAYVKFDDISVVDDSAPPPPPPPSGNNLVLNESFENYDSNDPAFDWILDGVSEPHAVNAGGDPDLDGARHVFFDANGNYLRFQQWIPVTEGKSYTVKGNVRLTGNLQGGYGASIQARFYAMDKTTAVGSAVKVTDGNLFGNQDWTEYITTCLTAETGAAFMRLRLICDKATQGRARFDLITVEEE